MSFQDASKSRVTNVCCRYVSLCSAVFTGLHDKPMYSATAIDLVNQLLPSLLLLHRDTVPNVRITLAHCLAQHSVCLGTLSFVLIQCFNKYTTLR